MLDFELETTPATDVEEDDWFGEGNSFESGEDLAAALLAMADGRPELPRPQPSQTRQGPLEATFLLSDPQEATRLLRERLARSEPDRYPTRTWSVRAPGAIALPPRVPGRTGWSIRNSVKVLQHTEEVINTLRKDAVVAAMQAAARAIHPEKASRRLPRFQTR